MAGNKVKWTAIVLTCSDAAWAQSLQKELEIRQAKGYIDKDVFLLTVEDPKQDVGSGGATINALLTVAEYISAQNGYSVLNPDVLENAYLLILHNGRSYAYEPCGRPFVTLPVKYTDADCDGTLCVLDLLIKSITEKVAVKSSPGIWVSSTDMILCIPHSEEIPWQACDACVITVPSTPQYCRAHGVYKINSEGFVEDILYKESLENLESCERNDGTVPVVCGLVYFSKLVAEKLLHFITKPPLDACTYFGVDSGQPIIQLSLFFDVMLAMCPGVNERDFRSGERSGTYGKKGEDYDRKTMRQARTILWKDLHSYRIRACMIEGGDYFYPYTVQEHKKNITERQLASCFPPKLLSWNNITHSYVQGTVNNKCCIINSVVGETVQIGAQSVVTNCCLEGDVVISPESFISGLVTEATLDRKEAVKFAESVIVQGYNLYLPTLCMNQYVLTTHGRFDNIQMPMWKSTSTFCNFPWLVFMTRTGITKEDLWGNSVEADEQTIMTARMFPVFHIKHPIGLTEILWLQGEIKDETGELLNRWRSSLRLSLGEILAMVDLKREFESRRSLFFQVSQRHIVDTLTNSKNQGFRTVYNAAVMEGYTTHLLDTLDSVNDTCISALQAGIAARTLANIADVLGCMAGPKGGLRSGPAANKAWAAPFRLLEGGDIRGGIKALAQERSHWLDRSDKLIRAARHYEGAAQILIRHAVMTAKEFYTLGEETMPPIGQWVLAESPARIDVSGGWSDTPPITYEHGGAVAMVALLIRGKRPIGAKTKRIKEPRLVFVLHDVNEQKEIVCQELSDLEDYYCPTSPGALLKAAFVCADVVDLKSKQTLSQQLQTHYDGGFELHSWSNLPHGSGLGTSSILAGAVLASILKAAGKSCDRKGLIHLVLYLEQLLTTGGGWQDQVGGLSGGIHLGLSDSKLPLFVDAVDLKVSPEIVQAFNNRLVLLYTGKTRLARNLLQDVVRNWYARNPQIMETEDKLVQLATECSKHFISGNLDAVGSCMSRYWVMKKQMAPGCEPESVTRLMKACQPFASGMCMAGAGGGGFMYILAKDAANKARIRDKVAEMEASDGIVVYEAEVDTEGLRVTLLPLETSEIADRECSRTVVDSVQSDGSGDHKPDKMEETNGTCLSSKEDVELMEKGTIAVSADDSCDAGKIENKCEGGSSSALDGRSGTGDAGEDERKEDEDGDEEHTEEVGMDDYYQQPEILPDD